MQINCIVGGRGGGGLGVVWASDMVLLWRHGQTHIKQVPGIAAAFNANVTNVLRLAAYALTLGKHL